MKLNLRLRPPEHSRYGVSTATTISEVMDCLAHKELFLEKWLFRMRR